WISALPIELQAARCMLDVVHGSWPQYHDPDTDSNSYTLGEINGHKVVMACLPQGRYGLVQAAVVATQLNATFKRIKVRLMVGIGGGMPPTSRASERSSVRLGDVVVGVFLKEFIVVL